MIGALFVFNRYGESLITRIYRDSDICEDATEAFRTKVIFAHRQLLNPVTFLEDDSATFFHIKCHDLWVCAVTRFNANAAMVFEVLNHFVKTVENYLHKMNEMTVRYNFVLIYELLDEMLDHGYPQITDFEMLKTYITQKGIKSVAKKSPQRITSQLTGAVCWRQEGIVHKKNALYVDVHETIDLLMAHDGKLVSSHVAGKISIRCFLSGMPECRLGINELPSTRGRMKVYLSAPTPVEERIPGLDFHFHQCVKLSKFNSEHTINFVPPDGDFELMRYRASKDLQLPFTIIGLVREPRPGKFEIKVFLKSLYPSNLSGQNIRVKIPVPPRTTKVKMTYAKGNAKYKMDNNEIAWDISRMSGGKRIELLAEMDLSDQVAAGSRDTWKRPPISMNFHVPYVPSGLKIRYLKVNEPKLHYSDRDVAKWVRYIGRAGKYETRC